MEPGDGCAVAGGDALRRFLDPVVSVDEPAKPVHRRGP
jgi:hypothetical protein